MFARSCKRGITDGVCKFGHMLVYMLCDIRISVFYTGDGRCQSAWNRPPRVLMADVIKFYVVVLKRVWSPIVTLLVTAACR